MSAIPPPTPNRCFRCSVKEPGLLAQCLSCQRQDEIDQLKYTIESFLRNSGARVYPQDTRYWVISNRSINPLRKAVGVKEQGDTCE